MPIEWDLKASRYDNLDLHVHDTDAPNWEARMASLLIDRWGMVVGGTDGEDSAGRSKLRLLSPEEIVERACATAQLAVAAFRARGWVQQLPSINEIREAREKRENGGPK
jgi:hypothetical protein